MLGDRKIVVLFASYIPIHYWLTLGNHECSQAHARNSSRFRKFVSAGMFKVKETIRGKRESTEVNENS